MKGDAKKMKVAKIKDCVKAGCELLTALITDFVEFFKSIYQLLIIVLLGLTSALLIIGSVGSHELGNIETFQFLLQVIIAFLLAAVLILYVKWQIAIEEKAELVERIEEERNRRANAMKIVDIAERGAKDFELYK